MSRIMVPIAFQSMHNVVDCAATLQLGNECLQGVIVLGLNYLCEDATQFGFDPSQGPRSSLANVAIEITKGSQQRPNAPGMLQSSQGHDGAEAHKPLRV